MKQFKDYLLVTIGSVIMAISLNAFLIPNKVAAGGVSGIATVLEHTLNLRPSLVIAIVNVPLFIAAFLMFGDRLLVRSIYATAVLSLAVEYLDIFGVATNDVLLAAVAGGTLMGIGTGFVIMKDATTGGTDIGARIFHKFAPHISVGKFILLIDTVIILWSGFVFKSMDLLIYATISLYITSKIVDNMVEGIDFAKGIYIISRESSKIANDIIINLERGVTGFRSIGIYSGTEGVVLLCVIRRNELIKIKEIVAKFDKKAFVILTDVREVVGEGFKNNI